MKQLMVLVALMILIGLVLVLLLSAANIKAEPKGPRSATAEGQSIPRALPASPSVPVGNQEPHDSIDWHAAFGPATWSNWALGVFAAVAAVVALRTLSAIRRQAEITVAIEAPFLSIALKFSAPQQIPRSVVTMNYWFQNHGRTPATLNEVCAVLKLQNFLLLYPDYEREGSRYQPGVTVVGPNGAKMEAPGITGGHFSGGDLAAVRPEEKYWIFYGFARYEDRAGREKILGFGFQYDVAMQSFMVIDNPNYTYHRQVKKTQWYNRFLPSCCK